MSAGVPVDPAAPAASTAATSAASALPASPAASAAPAIPTASAASAAPVLSCVGLERTFGALRAVDGVDLSLPAGARHALIGPNGAGKSTLFKLLAGGLRPTAGRVWLAGRDVTRLSDAPRARLGIGHMFQHSSLFLSMTVAENVALGARRTIGAPWSPVPRPSPALDQRIDQLLGDVGLLDRRGFPVGALSHGECRQLELAVALATAPRVLLLDEPAAGMSPAESARFAELIQRLPGAITLLFVEHDLDLVFRLATRVTVLHLGKVLLSGTPGEVQGSAEVQEAYLGTGRRADLFLPADRETPDRTDAARGPDALNAPGVVCEPDPPIQTDAVHELDGPIRTDALRHPDAPRADAIPDPGASNRPDGSRSDGANDPDTGAAGT